MRPHASFARPTRRPTIDETLPPSPPIGQSPAIPVRILKPTATFAALLVAATLSACGGAQGHLDKAGAERKVRPTVLTLAIPGSNPQEIHVWVEAVARLSEGRLVIRPVPGPHAGDAAYERRTIADVAAGKADLGWAGTRAWTELGVHGLDALNAPFAVDDYASQASLLRSPVSGRMLATVRKAGVEGVAILPGPLRYLLTKTPVSAPDDLRGQTIAITRSAVEDDLLHTLGADTVALPYLRSMGAADGGDAPLYAFYGNGDGHLATHLLGVPLGVRPLVVYADPERWEALSGADRAILTNAARAAIAPMTAQDQRAEATAFQQLCSAGVETTSASAARFRAAAAPVVAKLRSDPLTREALSGVRPSAVAHPKCQATPATTSTGLPAGRYVMRLRRSEPETRFENIASDFGPGDRVVRYTMTVGPKHIHIDTTNSLGTRPGFDEDYSVLRDRVSIAGGGLSMRWTLDGKRLTFSDIQSQDPSDAVLAAHPWVRIGR